MAGQFITLTMDAEKLQEVEGLLSGASNGMNRALSGAINKTLTHLRAGLVDDIKDQLYLGGAKATAIRDNVKIQHASQYNLSGFVRTDFASGKAVDFPHAEESTGVNVQFGPRNTQSFRGAFVAKMPSGHIGIFWREGPARREGRFDKKMHLTHTTLPIREIYGPSFKSVLSRQPEVLQRRLRDADAWLDRQMSSQVDRLLDRKKPETGLDGET